MDLSDIFAIIFFELSWNYEEDSFPNFQYNFRMIKTKRRKLQKLDLEDIDNNQAL